MEQLFSIATPEEAYKIITEQAIGRKRIPDVIRATVCQGGLRSRSDLGGLQLNPFPRINRSIVP